MPLMPAKFPAAFSANFSFVSSKLLVYSSAVWWMWMYVVLPPAHVLLPRAERPLLLLLLLLGDFLYLVRVVRVPSEIGCVHCNSSSSTCEALTWRFRSATTGTLVVRAFLVMRRRAMRVKKG